MPDQSLLLKRDPACDRKAEDADAVRRDSRVGRDAEKQKHGNGEKRAAADERAVGTGDESGYKKGGVFKKVHEREKRAGRRESEVMEPVGQSLARAGEALGEQFGQFDAEFRIVPE